MVWQSIWSQAVIVAFAGQHLDLEIEIPTDQKQLVLTVCNDLSQIQKIIGAINDNREFFRFLDPPAIDFAFEERAFPWEITVWFVHEIMPPFRWLPNRRSNVVLPSTCSIKGVCDLPFNSPVTPTPFIKAKPIWEQTDERAIEFLSSVFAQSRHKMLGSPLGWKR
ncbi:hypothetical protein OS190_11905 [Sulfitobacter sp. F26204]|uniref:hypothetical protein n=1 Tax=Sulfitobacter sp. F26204 TaxID=2996014 RepID=UPI00225DFF76|nr:hypothetical protein [Sulfitobacter sp. F26204]MCX7560274.1 hypothetical protein [Sulfitobacter sp. F26204]